MTAYRHHSAARLCSSILTVAAGTPPSDCEARWRAGIVPSKEIFEMNNIALPDAQSGERTH
jgi:hypothetical protein